MPVLRRVVVVGINGAKKHRNGAGGNDPKQEQHLRGYLPLAYTHTDARILASTVEMRRYGNRSAVHSITITNNNQHGVVERGEKRSSRSPGLCSLDICLQLSFFNDGKYPSL